MDRFITEKLNCGMVGTGSLGRWTADYIEVTCLYTLISWESLLLLTMALSTPEVGFMALKNATKESIHFRHLLTSYSLNKVKKKIIKLNGTKFHNESSDYVSNKNYGTINL